MTKFFITGLPRSRTAWCANFFTTADVFCYHDGLANCASLDEFDRKLSGHAIAGDSDSGLVYFYEELRARYPAAQWAVIRRDPLSVVRSLIAMTPYRDHAPIGVADADRVVSDLDARLDQLAAQPGVLSLRFDDLATREGARALWWHCLRDRVPWNGERWQMLNDLRVTVASERVSVSHAAARSLLAGRAA